MSDSCIKEAVPSFMPLSSPTETFCVASVKILVSTSPVRVMSVGRARPIIQNLGPGTVYLDTSSSVSASESLKLSTGVVYEFPTSGAYTEIWLVSDESNTDVRFVEVG